MKNLILFQTLGEPTSQVSTAQIFDIFAYSVFSAVVSHANCKHPIPISLRLVKIDHAVFLFQGNIDVFSKYTGCFL